ncbi:butyrophilin subfamily 3 member A2-like [Anarhichas minor]|uniref:butyrophilin subfamily 3 member A2-like n=1 Tax=Anarhichas minor TaxID=65739 RepID=UPI003F738E60
MLGFKLLPFTPLELLSLFSCLLTLTGTILGHEGVVRKVVEDGSDVILPCSLSNKQDIVGAVFHWKKVAQKGQRQEVFFYDAGRHYKNGLDGQSEQFRGRVSHFEDELKHGNASISIRNTKMADSGNYTCAFPLLQPPQTFYIELVVGAAPEPFIRTLDASEDWSLLQCEVRGASPQPAVEWQDGAGNRLPAEEPQVSERGGSYDITLNITVKKTDRYRCVVEQEDIKHRVTSETFVHISGPRQQENGLVHLENAQLNGRISSCGDPSGVLPESAEAS